MTDINQMDYIYGKVNIKCVYDDSRVYFNFKIPGPYRHDPEDKHKSPAVSTMFQIGSNATLYVSYSLLIFVVIVQEINLT